MATMCHSRRALMEIPAPQPKIAARMRRSYLEVLSSRIAPFSTTSRGRNLTSNSKRGHSLDPAIYRTGSSRSEAQSERMEDDQTPLSNQQLVQLIRSFILVEQGQRQEPRALTTDLKPLQEDLHLKKTNVYRSIPYSRLGSNRDAHCYRKAYPHLVVFKVSCQEWGQLLLQNEEWQSALEHALVAWRYTSELPQWDTSSHNLVREQCYRMLAAHCITALQHYCPDPSKAIELHRRETAHWCPSGKLKYVWTFDQHNFFLMETPGVKYSYSGKKRFKMAQLHSQLISPCIQELERSLGEAQVCSMNTR